MLLIPSYLWRRFRLELRNAKVFESGDTLTFVDWRGTSKVIEKQQIARLNGGHVELSSGEWVPIPILTTQHELRMHLVEIADFNTYYRDRAVARG